MDKKRRKPLSECSARHIRRLLKSSLEAPVCVTLPSESCVSHSRNNNESEVEPAVDTVPSNDACHAISELSGVDDNLFDELNGSQSTDGDDSSSVLSREPFIQGSMNELECEPVSCDCSLCVTSSSSAHLASDIAGWAVRRNIPHDALHDLLVVLHKYHDELPVNPRTLLGTPKVTLIREMPPGQFHYRGLSSGLESLLATTKDLQQLTTLCLLVNFDGLPISKSSTSVLWPILASVLPTSPVFLVGCYHGYEKPSDVNDYLREFVSDLTSLINDGFNFQGKNYNIILEGIICDVPAKSYILCVKGHCGYFSCSKCTVEGSYMQNRMCFHEMDAPLRTDRSFRQRENPEYHTGSSLIEEIPNFNLIENIPYDYMHLCLEGVVKKLLMLWLHGPLSCRLRGTKIDELSVRIGKIAPCIPAEFSRSPRLLKYVSMWKATEFRLFLLYTGPVILQGVIDDDVYLNFMTLHVAITILSSPKYCRKLCDYAEALLRYFVSSFEEVYGTCYMSHNVHGLIHLASDVRKFGPLDTFSAFKFENFLQTVKNQLRKADKPLQQIARRYAECCNVVVPRMVTEGSKFCLKQEHKSGPLPAGCTGPQYMCVNLSSYKLTTEDPNSCCGLNDGTIVCIINIAHNVSERSVVIIGFKLSGLQPVYMSPCDSQQLGIFKVSTVSSIIEFWPLRLVVTKYVKVPASNGSFLLFPLIHLQ